MQDNTKNTMIGSAPKKKDGEKPVAKKKEKPGKVKEEKPAKEVKEKKQAIQIVEKHLTSNDAEDAFKKMTKPQIELIKSTLAKGATDDELKLFLNVCVGARLNPFLRQVHFVKRWDSKQGKEVGQIQVGIDGFRAIAEGGGQYAGSDDPIIEMDENTKLPIKATVTVYKLMENGERYPFTATAHWVEYCPADKMAFMWKKMPKGQIGKCAEALALRKGFPKLLSGLYAPEELEKVDDKPAETMLDKATNAIGKLPAEKLPELKEKIEGSKKYSQDDKDKLLKQIDERLNANT